ncbi:MAG: MFS transporter [Archangiaceae bacterium]|nr:MFS transporter [Archangiaceae bacterium]
MTAAAATASAPTELPTGFRARRTQNWVLVGLLYSFFYMSRYNFSAVSTDMMAVLGWTKAEHLSIFETIFPFVYGVSVVVNGPIADRIGGKRAFLIGAAGVVVMNLVFGAFGWLVMAPAVMSADHKAVLTAAQFTGGFDATSLAWTMAIAWAVNGYFQSFGALSIVKINAQWFPIKERGTFAAIFGVLIRFGLILSFSGCPLLVAWFGWQWAFFIPAGFVAVMFVLVLLFVVEKPEDAGYPRVETGDASGGESTGKVSAIGIFLKVLSNPVMLTIAVGSMMIGIVRRSIIDTSWWPAYMREMHHVGKTDFAYQLTSTGMAVTGIIGGFVLGWASDRVFTSRRAPVVAVGFIGMTACLGLFLLSDVLALGPIGAAACIMLLSFFINGAHGMIGGAASMDFGGKKGAATAAGLFDGMQYLAAAPIAGWLVPRLTEHYGWQAWKYLTIPWAVLGFLVMLRIWNALPRSTPGH